MLIPDAWSKRRKTISKAHQNLFNFLNSTIEPWDGPAAIAATDGRWTIVATDRNGLRPLRYTISKDKLLFAGSETGMVKIPSEKNVFKGRHGPGNNLFIFIEDPDGNWIEISAELEVIHDRQVKVWKHEPKTLNLWGPHSIMRS